MSELLSYHKELFLDFKKEVEERDKKRKEDGCTCGFDAAWMLNAGTTSMEMFTEWGRFDDQCPTCSS